jgi:hypothetical protein
LGFALHQFEGGKPGQAYRDLDSEYKQSEERAAAVRKRIADVETVGSD